jgi:ribosomal protein S9
MIEPPKFSAVPWPTQRDMVIAYLNHHKPHTAYGIGEVDITEAYLTLKRYQRQLKIAISLHGFVLYCLARAAHQHPCLQTYRHRGQLITFADVDICTAIDKRGHVPIAYTVRAAQSKSLAQINWELRQALRSDPMEHEAVRRRRAILRLPRLLRLWMLSRILKNPFLLKQYYGTIGLTSLQTPGLRQPFTALAPNIYTFILTVGTLVHRTVFDAEGNRKPRKILYLSGGADHAVVDGMPLARFAKDFADLIESAAGLDESFLEETCQLMSSDHAIYSQR